MRKTAEDDLEAIVDSFFIGAIACAMNGSLVEQCL
jgi:hypothetical protein